MGNCLHRQSSTQWGGEDWESPTPEPVFGRHSTQGNNNKVMNMEEKGLIGDKMNLVSSNLKSSTTEVKIKITKKQLEELLSKADIKQLTAQQVLSQLINVGDINETRHKPTSWRPNLRSIPE